MKILFISNFFPPENVAASFRAYENCEAWSKTEKVTVLTGNPNYPTGKLFSNYKNNLFSSEEIKKIKVFRSKVFILPNKNLLFQGLNTLGFLFFGILNIIFNGKKINKQDIVIGTSGQILTPFIALLFSKLNKIPFVLELRDLSFIQLLALGKTERSIIFKLIKKIELFLCDKSNLIIVVTEGFKDELIENGISKNKIRVIPNGVNFRTETITKNKNKNKIIISFFGNFGKSQGILENIKLFNMLFSEIEFLFIGAGKEKERIQDYLSENPEIKILFLESMSQTELEKYYIESDLCLVSLFNSKFFKNTIPSKIFQNAQRKKAILYIGPKCEGSEIIKKGNFGYVIELENDIEENKLKLKKIILEIKNNPNILHEMGENGYKLIKKDYNREVLAKKYLNYLKEII